MERNQPFPSIVKLVVGLFFTAVGILLTADNLGVLDAEDFLIYWPAIMVVIGVLKLFDAGTRMVGTLLIIGGSWFLSLNAGLVRFSFFDMWPLLLIAVGAMVVARAVGVGPKSFSLPANIAPLFGQKNVVESSNDYRGGSAAAFLAGYELDLSGADITNGPAVVEVLAIWGGIVIYVPDNWEIVGEVVPIMAGFEVQTSGSDPRKQLIIKGLALMAGIEVKRKS